MHIIVPKAHCQLGWVCKHTHIFLFASAVLNCRITFVARVDLKADWTQFIIFRNESKDLRFYTF